jgi:hypothetical protein
MRSMTERHGGGSSAWTSTWTRKHTHMHTHTHTHTDLVVDVGGAVGRLSVEGAAEGQRFCRTQVGQMRDAGCDAEDKRDCTEEGTEVHAGEALPAWSGVLAVLGVVPDQTSLAGQVKAGPHQGYASIKTLVVMLLSKCTEKRDPASRFKNGLPVITRGAPYWPSPWPFEMGARYSHNGLLLPDVHTRRAGPAEPSLRHWQRAKADAKAASQAKSCRHWTGRLGAAVVPTR